MVIVFKEEYPYFRMYISLFTFTKATINKPLSTWEVRGTHHTSSGKDVLEFNLTVKRSLRQFIQVSIDFIPKVANHIMFLPYFVYFTRNLETLLKLPMFLHSTSKLY